MRENITVILFIVLCITINWRLSKIMGSQSEAAASLNALRDDLASTNAELGKAKDELLAKIKALEDAASNAGNVGPELQAAIDGVVGAGAGVKDAAKAVDDIVPDAPTTTGEPT